MHVCMYVCMYVCMCVFVYVVMSRSISARAISSNQGTSPLAHTEIDIRHSSFSKVSKFFQFASSTLGLLELQEVSSGVDAVASIARQHDLFKTHKADILVEDADLFRNEIQTVNATSSALDAGSNTHSSPLSGLRASDVIANVEIGSAVKVMDIYKLTKDLKKEFQAFISEGSDTGGKSERYYTGAEVRVHILAIIFLCDDGLLLCESCMCLCMYVLFMYVCACVIS